MRMTLITMAAVSALAIGAPAVAQYPSNGQNNYPNNYQNGANTNGNIVMRIRNLDARLQAGIQSGAISRREAAPLRAKLRQLSEAERRYSVNGISGRERADLQQRMRTLRQQMRVADGGANGRYDRWDRDDNYGDNNYGGNYGDNYGSNQGYDRVDANGDGYDDRDYNRDGRWDDDQRNGGYQQPVQRSGLGGIVDSLFGTGGLQVGQRAPDNLYGVPTEYRDQYRDGNGAYYRSDGRQIYQVDARTGSVVRVYAMNR